MRPRGPTAEPRPLRFGACVTGCHHWDPALIYIARLLGILARNRRSFAHKICARHIVMLLPRHNCGGPTKDPCPRYIRPLSTILLSERQLSEGNFNLYAESRTCVRSYGKDGGSRCWQKSYRWKDNQVGPTYARGNWQNDFTLPYWMQKHRMLEEPPSYRVLGVPMQRCPGRIESARGQR